MKLLTVLSLSVCMLFSCSQKNPLPNFQRNSLIVVQGEVVVPGEYTVSNRGLVNAIVTAGGMTKKSSTKIDIIGKNSATETNYDTMFSFELYDIVFGGKGDLWVPEGWKIVVRNPFVGGAPDSVNDALSKFLEQRSVASNPDFDLRLYKFSRGEITYEDVKSLEGSD